MRRRYDTFSFVNEAIRKQRRAVISLIVGIPVLAGLIAAYFSICGAPKIATLPERAAKSKHQIETVNPPAPTTATVTLELTDKGQAWIDNNELGQVTTHEEELSVGQHTLRVKIGGRTLTTGLIVQAGERYTVRFDPKKRRPEIKREP
jgi:hypothetical protein